MSGQPLKVIGHVVARNAPAETFGAITEDRVVFAALIITAAGNAVRVREIESMETDKSENGDAGTWSFSAPLAENRAAASQIGPMDLVALYAIRIMSDLGGLTSQSADVLNVIPHGTATSGGFTYGSADATIIKSLGADAASCLMIGMIDAVEEDFDYQQARMTLDVRGRDLTKVLIDNDTYVPYTDAAGGDNGVASSLSAISLTRETSGTGMLLDILDVFVGKDPNRIAQILANSPNVLVPKDNVLSSIKKFGYPWRSFLRVDALIAGFKHLGHGQFAKYSVQGGSAWTNIGELRNFPIARLFVDEIGRLIFDDTWTAWGYGTDTASLSAGTDGKPRKVLKVVNSEVRKATFRQADDDLVTGITITAAAVVGADTDLASGALLSQPRHTTLPMIQQYGYRFVPWVSQYDDVNAFGVSKSGTLATTGAAAAPTSSAPMTANAMSEAIFNAAQTFKASHLAAGSTRGLKGAPSRNECCAAVESVLDLAGVPEIGTNPTYVPAFVAGLPARGWTVVSAAQAVRGDFVILGDRDHIGIYEGNNLMISNGSTRGSFTWEDTPAAQQAYYPVGAPQFWHYSGDATTPTAPAVPASAAPATPAAATSKTDNALSARFPILWRLHNDLWTATFVMKGSTRWRAGQRLSTTLGGAQPATTPLPGLEKYWYIMSVKNSLNWGSDWTTTVVARFPLNPSLGANVVGDSAAPLG
jgi:hypothetical protein